MAQQERQEKTWDVPISSSFAQRGNLQHLEVWLDAAVHNGLVYISL
jgi:hypothetical protein